MRELVGVGKGMVQRRSVNRGGWRSMVSCAACRSFYDWCHLGGAAKLRKCSTGSRDFSLETGLKMHKRDALRTTNGGLIMVRHYAVLPVALPH